MAVAERNAERAVSFGVIGAGTMGRGIARWAAQAGLAVTLYDTAPDAVASALKLMRKDLAKLIERGRLTEDDADKMIARIQPAGNLGAFAACDLIVEEIVEDLEIKIALFRSLEAIVSDRAILPTNTSSLSVAALAAGCRVPSRVAGCSAESFA